MGLDSLEVAKSGWPSSHRAGCVTPVGEAAIPWEVAKTGWPSSHRVGSVAAMGLDSLQSGWPSSQKEGSGKGR